MELRDLIGALEAPMLMGADNVDITNIQSDSRRVTKGSLFVAVRGTAVDGHAYMDSAIEKGAVAIVCEEAPSYLEGRCSFIVVKDGYLFIILSIIVLFFFACTSSMRLLMSWKRFIWRWRNRLRHWSQVMWMTI